MNDNKYRTINVKDIVTDDELKIAFAYANFGNMTKREVLRQGLLKCAGHWYQGHTSKMILIELGLITKKYKLTKKGGRYLYAAYHNGSNF